MLALWLGMPEDREMRTETDNLELERRPLNMSSMCPVGGTQDGNTTTLGTA